MSLANKYRPVEFSDVVGNEGVVESLKALLERGDNTPHAFLFTGPSGGGKTSIGRIVAKSLGVKGFDFIEVDSGDYRGIDTVRTIRQRAFNAPMEGERRAWLIDECHALTKDAQDAFLKLLEEPPAHAYFILCTTDPSKLSDALRRRCSKHEVKALNDDTIFKLLRKVAHKEGKPVDKEVFYKITDIAKGSPGEALNILDNVIDIEPEKMLESVAPTVDNKEIIDLCRTLMEGKVVWMAVAKMIKAMTKDPEQIRHAVLGYFNAVLLKQDSGRAYLIIKAFENPFYSGGKASLTAACYDALFAE